MKLDNMFKKLPQAGGRKDIGDRTSSAPEVPEGLLRRCNKCGKPIFVEDVQRGSYQCPKCGYNFRMPAWERLEMLADKESFCQWDMQLPRKNPMEYRGYLEKLAALEEKTGMDEAIITGRCTICGQKTAIGICDGRFLMASMGEAMGEKITRAVERATKEGLPVILVACSGGARMQEGIVSLMQMAKTAAALKRHSDAGLLYVSVLTDPTTGGVTASFGMLGDVIVAEPKALIGFAGPRVIEQTIRQRLPRGFQRSEFLLEHGFLDAVVERAGLRVFLGKMLELHSHKEESVWKTAREENCGEVPAAKEAVSPKALLYQPWERVALSRAKDRPVGSDYIQRIFPDFTEFHGDRLYGDDKAVMGGIATFQGRPVTVIAQVKGTNTRENLERNFGMPSPEGYRKALRLMKQAEKFHRPVISLVDTPGAFCGLEAEERGQGEAIARSIYEMSALKTPILSIIIGEGGSGGALAGATADEVWMLENSVYSILSPEGFASILWKDSSRAQEAAEVMKLTAEELKKLGIVERIFLEPEHYTADTMAVVTEALENAIEEFLEHYGELSLQELQEHRYQRFRKM